MVPTSFHTRRFSASRLLPAFLCLGFSLICLYGQTANGLEQKAIRRLMSSGPVLARPFLAHNMGAAVKAAGMRTFTFHVRPFATNDNWLGGPGNWSNAASWSAGVPTAGSDVFISDHIPSSVVTLNVTGNANNLTIGGTSSLNFNNNTSLTISGSTITNSNNTGTGGITLNSGGNVTDLIIGSSSVTLTGGGTVTLSNNPNNRIYGGVAADLLTNANNTIQGSGNIGVSRMTLVNQGTINANQATPLTIQTSNGTTNTGTLGATAGGNLILLGDTYTNAGGTILASGANSVVTLQNPTINGGVLNTASGGLIQASGSPTLNGVTNSGTYQVPNNQETIFQGTVTNNGNIQVNSAGNNTKLSVSGAVSLTGGGTVTLSDNNANYIYNPGGGSLTNVNNTISGSGNIGNGSMAFTNQAGGVVNANSPTGHLLTIQTGPEVVTNLGLMEASGGGTLQLMNSIVNTNGTINGTIEALNGSVVLLNGATVSGGTLATAGTGVVQGISGATLDGSGNTITNAGNLQVLNNNTVYMKGAVNNTGTLTLNSVGNNTVLLVNNSAATLQGAGTVTLSDNNNNYIGAAAPGNQLINKQTIQGAGGNIGNNSLVILNQGTIDATVSAGGTTLTIQPYGTLTNSGLLEATGGGSLALFGGTFANTGGTITAGSGSTVTLKGGVTVAGGTLNGAGSFVAQSGAQLDGSGGAITSAGNLHIPNNNYLYIQGTINNTGTLFVDSVGNAAQLLVNSPAATLQGSGTVTLSDNNNNYIGAAAAGNQLINTQTIQGPGGNIGNNSLVIVNQGTIDATPSAGGSTLTIQPYGTLTNTGLLEATDGGSLALYGGTFTNTGGTITAGSGSTVTLKGGVTVAGGTLNGAGSFVAQSGSQLDGSGGALTSAGNLHIPNNNYLYVQGAINNTGTLFLDSGGNATQLLVNSPIATLQGGGTVTLSDNNANYIQAAAAGNQLINAQTIQGAGGNIGNGNLVIANQGVINAKASAGGQTLTIQPGTTLTNTGLLEATGGGTLALFGGTFSNASGVITAGSGSNVLFAGGANVAGGTLNGAGTFTSFTGTTFNGVTNAGNIQVPNNNSTTLAGTINNTGSLRLNSGGNNTVFSASGPVTLTGGGTLAMSDNNANYIFNPGGGSLTNANNTISGSGNIGNGSMAFTNQAGGVVNAASAAGQSLTINSGAAGAVNAGVFAASSGGTLILNNSIDNTGGAIQALAGTGSNAGGSVVINGAAITGGTLNTLGTGVNVGSMIAQNSALLSGVTNNAAIQIPNNTAAQLAGTVTNNGSIQVNSGGNNTFLHINGNTTLNGKGTIALSNNGANYVDGASGTEVLTNNGNTIRGSGTLGNGSLGLVNNGTVLANQSTPLYIRPNISGFTNNGTVTVNAGSLLNITAGPFTNFNSGTGTLTGGTYNVTGTLQFDNADQNQLGRDA